LVKQGLPGFVDENGFAVRSKRSEFVNLGKELIDRVL
jgi:hypothetical protein